jgi:hypothetical protein
MQYVGIDWAYRRAAWCALGEGWCATPSRTPVDRQAPSPLRRPDLSRLHRPCRIRTICRRPSHAGQAGIVSVRVGTRLQVTSPHRWHTSSACAAVSPRRALPARALNPSREVSIA